MPSDFRNVQGIIPHLPRRPFVRHLLFRFGEGAGARAFLRSIVPEITMAEPPPDAVPDPLVNVGITYQGLEALGVERTRAPGTLLGVPGGTRSG